MSFDPFYLAINVVAILLVLTVHEFSHAFVADSLGDDTARRMGRLTLNPLAHLDILGTLLMFIASFGWAKPVPVNPRNLRNPKTEMIYIAAAGPLSNLLTAIVAGFAIRFILGFGAGGFLDSSAGVFTVSLLFPLMTYSIALAVFNLIPVPPLDGSRILYGVLPQTAADFYARFEKVGILALFALFIFAGHGFMRVIWTPVRELSVLLSGVPGAF